MSIRARSHCVETRCCFFPAVAIRSHKPATENGGPCVVSSEVVARVHTRYSTDIIVGPAHLVAGQVGPRGILGGKRSHFSMILRAKR